jgi:predicted methyltransferase
VALNAGALRVITIELEPNVHRISLMNPWSQKLYQSNEISCILGDSFFVANGLPSELFDIIIHDPPRHRYAGHLYGLAFYQKLFRLLKPGGKIFHYTGEPRSRYRGVNISKGVSQRLLKAGFRDVKYHDNVMGLIALKN